MNKEKYTYWGVIGLLVLAILFITKCKNDSISNLKKETIISQNNLEVLQDSIKKFKTKNGLLVNERGVLISNEKKLNELNKELYDEYVKVSKQLKIKPSVIVKQKTKIVHDTVYIETNLDKLSDSVYVVYFDSDTFYNENNYRRIGGYVPITLMSDSSKWNKVDIGKSVISKDEISMEASLVLGTKDDKLKVWLTSEYPNFDISQIDAVTLDPSIHPELKKLNNKRFSAGPYIGIGVNEKLQFRPQIGIGVQYRLIKF